MDPARFDGLTLPTGSEYDIRRRVLRVDPRVRLCRLYASSPDTVLKAAEAGNAPSHLGANTADLIEDGARSWTWRDQNVIREHAHLVLRTVGREFDEGF